MGGADTRPRHRLRPVCLPHVQMRLMRSKSDGTALRRAMVAMELEDAAERDGGASGGSSPKASRSALPGYMQSTNSSRRLSRAVTMNAGAMAGLYADDPESPTAGDGGLGHREQLARLRGYSTPGSGSGGGASPARELAVGQALGGVDPVLAASLVEVTNSMLGGELTGGDTPYRSIGAALALRQLPIEVASSHFWVNIVGNAEAADDAEAVRRMVGACTRKTFAAGDTICALGDTATELYVLQSGECDVIDPPDFTEDMVMHVSALDGGGDTRQRSSSYGGDGGVLVRLGAGAVVGELAVLGHCPRQCTVVAATDVTAMALPAEAFYANGGEKAFAMRQRYAPLLAQVPLFESVPAYVLQTLADEIFEETFDDGATVILCGRPERGGEKVRIVADGRAVVLLDQPSTSGGHDTGTEHAAGGISQGSATCDRQCSSSGGAGGNSGGGSKPGVREVWRLRHAEIFGEVAAVSVSGRPTATVLAVGELRCVCLTASKFRKLLVEFPEVATRVAENVASYEFGAGGAPDLLEDLDEKVVERARGGGAGEGGGVGVSGGEGRRQAGHSTAPRWKGIGGGSRRQPATSRPVPARSRAARESRSRERESERDSSMARLAAMRTKVLSKDAFDLFGEIGRGAHGVVWLARHRQSASMVAIKSMERAKVEASLNGATHLRAETSLSKRIAHAGIVNTYGSFADSHFTYIVMEAMCGGTLLDAIRAAPGGRLDEDSARIVTAELVCGIAHLHASNTVHRDLKPGNVLLDEDAHARIADFGFARQLWCDDERAWSVCGTVEFLAPEVLTGMGHGKPADWWALGVILFQMTTGKCPYSDPQRRTNVIFEKVMTLTPTLPSHLSTAGRSLLGALLVRDADQRLGTAGGAAAVKAHPWFEGIDWERVGTSRLTAPPALAQTVRERASKTTAYAMADESASWPRAEEAIVTAAVTAKTADKKVDKYGADIWDM